MKSRRFLAAAFALVFLAILAGQASAHIIITPLRFVFENKTRSHTLLVMNGDSKPHTYRLGWKLMKMDDKGQYHDLPMEDGNPYSVPNMVIFSPRQVTLAPGARQNVRLALRRPADLPPGEYRGHLMFSELLPEDAPKGDTPQGPAIALKLKIGVTVPVIVRSGEIKTGDIALGTPRVETEEGGRQALRLDLSHAPGHGSVYGQVLVKTDANEEIGVLNNVALYPEMDKRSVSIPLTRPVAAGTTVQVSYEGAGEYKGQTFAKTKATVSR